MKHSIILLLTIISLSLFSQEKIQWRGDRTGIYNETNLLKSWKPEGPKMLWHFDGLGEGHSSVAIANNKIYVTGLVNGQGHIFVFDMSGLLLNNSTYGPEWSKNYNGSRSTVTISDGKLYIYSGLGTLTCLDENSLKILWKKNIVDDFKGSNIMWGVNESPLIVGEKVILTPGGKENNVVALDKNTGKTIWVCSGEGDVPAYCSPLYISDIEVPQIVTMTAKHILGIDAKTGQKLWSYEYHNSRNIHPNTPIYSDNKLLCISGYGKGAIMLQLSNGGRKVEKIWENKEFDPKTGSAVKIGDYIYGSGDNNKYWLCLEWNTGIQTYSDKSIAVGNVIAADNMLYCYSEKGDMALVKPNPEKFEIVSKFKITLGTEQHWAHPVINQGVLYVRHGNTVMAYDVKR